ncbi:MAG: P-II family nitrogen regulator [Thomasclavelia sp.]|jgi:nitrogen regulatory protein P-II 1|nr:P-II family nitrogen regulator [Thomasclavelia sp.]
MKKVEVIIRPEKLDEIKDILTDCGISGMMVSNVMGFGNQMGYTQQYRGTKYNVNLLPKLRIETIVKDSQVDQMVKEVTEKLRSGEVGDGKIFVIPVENAVRIRTGETGEEAL